MNATFVGFDTLKRSVSMLQVLERYELLNRLHRSGDNLSGACPLHAGHNKTQFRVSLSRNCWICFGDCHRGGSIVDFVSLKESVGIREAALLIQEWFGLQPNSAATERNSHPRGAIGSGAERICEPAPGAMVNPPLGFTLARLDQTHPYLAARGLSRETIETFGVGYCANGMFAGWIAIPIHNAAGQLVAYAGRWPGPPPEDKPRYRLPKGFRKSLELFNLHRALAVDGDEPLVVVEGFFGCMKVWQAGQQRVVSLMGSMLSPKQEELIARAAGPDHRVLLLFDEDEAGRKGRAEAQGRLAPRRKVQIVRFETEGMQPDQLSAEELRSLLNL